MKGNWSPLLPRRRFEFLYSCLDHRLSAAWHRPLSSYPGVAGRFTPSSRGSSLILVRAFSAGRFSSSGRNAGWDVSRMSPNRVSFFGLLARRAVTKRATQLSTNPAGIVYTHLARRQLLSARLDRQPTIPKTAVARSSPARPPGRRETTSLLISLPGSNKNLLRRPTTRLAQLKSGGGKPRS